MSIWRGLLNKIGLSAGLRAERTPIAVFLLDDDERRHQWFQKRFAKDRLDIAETPEEAKELLSKNTYDAIFLDHDLLPEHYKSNEPDDENTGFAVAAWLAANPDVNPAARILVHTRNADAAIRMIEKMREAGRQAEYAPYTLLEQRIKNYWQT
jgi:CheY-like chemotaxis protein